ncbi:MAG TPA: thioredoxin [Gemmatimonadaceae bacterium]|nr:thioredoxin [Gemmatimonadaceae bacterium]
MSDNVKTVTDASFENDVLKASGPVLVDFWAPWCGPCRMIAPMMEKLATDYAGKVTIAKVNVDESPETQRRYGIRSIPMVALFNNGESVDGILGAMPQKAFTDMLDKHLNATATSTAGTAR